MVEGFFGNFNKHYEDAVQRDFKKMSLVDQMEFVEHLFKVCLVSCPAASGPFPPDPRIYWSLSPPSVSGCVRALGRPHHQ